MNPGRAARYYLRARRHGALATISKKLDGYPFGSVAPYMLDHAARPVILISLLAEHTKNIDADPRVSLLVHEPVADVLAAARLTLVGNAARCNDEETTRTRYLNYFPDAAQLFELHDFSFYRIVPTALRYIGGFGEIHWISTEDYVPPANCLAEQEAKIIAHMNIDHARNLCDYCRHFKQRTTSLAIMIGIDCDGFDVRTDNEVLRFDFEQPVSDANEARQALVAMAHQARAI